MVVQVPYNLVEEVIPSYRYAVAVKLSGVPVEIVGPLVISLDREVAFTFVYRKVAGNADTRHVQGGRDILRVSRHLGYRCAGRDLQQVCVGGIDKRQINLDQVEDFPIILPPLEQQIRFSEFVEQVDKSKVVIQESLNKTQLMFDSLMQEYFG